MLPGQPRAVSAGWCAESWMYEVAWQVWPGSGPSIHPIGVRSTTERRESINCDSTWAWPQHSGLGVSPRGFKSVRYTTYVWWLAVMIRSPSDRSGSDQIGAYTCKLDVEDPISSGFAHFSTACLGAPFWLMTVEGTDGAETRTPTDTR